MLSYLKEEATKMTTTENGAYTYTSTANACLDLFSTIGALRQADEAKINTTFSLAYAENPDLAVKILFFARDVRGGLGERYVPRVIFHWLANNHPESLLKNMANLPEYGRFDDLLVCLDTPCQQAMVMFIAEQLAKDLALLENEEEGVSLLGKWLPSVNASNSTTIKQAKKLAHALGLSQEAYRKTLSRLRKKIAIIENNLRESDYTFDYAKQPSKAMFKYRQAFLRNDGSRYRNFMEKVRNQECSLHTGILYPYEVIRPCLDFSIDADQELALDATWRSLPDYTTDEDALVVIDGSGSMYGGQSPTPASVALSLGIYFAQHNKGAFKNHFITFSEHPQLVEIQGQTIVEQVQYCTQYNEIANTNLQAVFQLILTTATKHHLTQKDLPATLYIISDMEFDSCTQGATTTNFAYAQKKFAQYGYTLPKIVFWNVDSRNTQQPVTYNQQGVALVSGASPRLFSMVLAGNLSPYHYMLEMLNSPRYAHLMA